jgi:hypothetical protein
MAPREPGIRMFGRSPHGLNHQRKPWTPEVPLPIVNHLGTVSNHPVDDGPIPFSNQSQVMGSTTKRMSAKAGRVHPQRGCCRCVTGSQIQLCKVQAGVHSTLRYPGMAGLPGCISQIGAGIPLAETAAMKGLESSLPRCWRQRLPHSQLHLGNGLSRSSIVQASAHSFL